MMWSMWDAPSDRDYYDQFNLHPEEEEEPNCWDCGARWDQVCGECCPSRLPAAEPAPNFAAIATTSTQPTASANPGGSH